MATERIPGDEPPAALRIVAPTGTDAFHHDWTGRVGALSALARPELVRGGFRYLSYALLGALIGVLLLVATATVPVLFGYHNYVVNGGSMEPALRAGSVAVTAPTSPRALQIGDIIAWRQSSGSQAVLHRIVEIKSEDGQPIFVTQGDQNQTADPRPVALQGPGDRVVYSVPYAGHILNFARSAQGRVVLIGAPLLLLAALFLRNSARSQPARRARSEPAVVAMQQPPPLLPVVAPQPPPPPLPVVTAISARAAERELPEFLVRQLRQYRGDAQAAPQILAAA